MYIDLNWEVRTNAEFQHKLRTLGKELQIIESKTGSDPAASDKAGSIILDIYRLCKYNAGLLVPYFFPKYPYDKPLSCSNRPYSFAMFHMQIGGSITFRAGRQIGKCIGKFTRVITLYNNTITERTAQEIFELAEELNDK